MSEDPFMRWVDEVTRRTAVRLGVGERTSFDDIADHLGVSFEEAIARWGEASRTVEAEMVAEGLSQPAPPTPEEYLASLNLSDEVHRVADGGDDGERWERLSPEPHVRAVSAARGYDDDWPWVMTVWAMEFVREDPLETQLRTRIDEAVRQIPGVTDVIEGDREVWLIKGSMSGESLVRAIARLLDELAPGIRPYVNPTST